MGLTCQNVATLVPLTLHGEEASVVAFLSDQEGDGYDKA